MPSQRAGQYVRRVLSLLGDSNMAIYQCFFFSEDRIAYWENIECDGSMRLTAALRDRLKNGKWKHAEAWAHGQLVCDVRRLPPSNEDASKLLSSQPVPSLVE